MTDKAFEDIPGTFVFNGERSRRGYPINMFCMSLMTAENREAFKADESAYLDRFGVTPEQKAAVLGRQWNDMLRQGGTVYFTAKLAATDGVPVAHISAAMAGMTPDKYIEMMVGGGRRVSGKE